MGNCHSKGDSGTRDNPPRRAMLGDFDPAGNKKTLSPPSKQQSYNIALSERSSPYPPKYSAQPQSVAYILDLLKECSKHGIFEILRHRNIRVWYDDNPALNSTTKAAMRLLMHLILALGKIYDSNMEIFCTSQPNLDSRSLTDDDRQKAEALAGLFITSSWAEAITLVDNCSTLKEMGLDRWIAKARGPSPSITDRSQANHHTPGLPPSSNEDKTTDAERHIELLSHDRELKRPYWYGWHQRDVELEDLMGILRKASTESKKQPKLRNSIRFTMETEYALQRRLQMKGKDGIPTTVLILSGSPIVTSELRALQAEQDKTQDGASEFSIQFVTLTDFLDADSKKAYAKLDNNKSGSRDLLDTLPTSESDLCQQGPSMVWMNKLLNSHDKRLDAMNLSEREKYGTGVLGREITLPTLEDMRKACGETEDI